MENITNSNNLRFKCSVFTAFTVLYFLQVLHKQYLLCRGSPLDKHCRSVCDSLFHPHLPCPRSPSCWLLLPQFTQMNKLCDTPQGICLRLQELLWRAPKGNKESRWLHTEADKERSSTFSCWLRWGWKLLALKWRGIVLNFMYHFHLSDLTKNLIQVFPPD